MKVLINKQTLMNVLQLANEASEKDNLHSYFSYFVFEARGKNLLIKSANRQTSFEQTLVSDDVNKLTIEREGAFLILGSKVVNIVASLHDGIICFEAIDLNVRITEYDTAVSDIEFKIRLRSLEDFPADIHTVTKNEFKKVSKDDFLHILKNTSFAISPNVRDTNLFLTGVFFDVEKESISAVATDRNRMSISVMQTEDMESFINDKGDEKDIIIPLKSVLFLKRVFSRMEEEKDLYIALEDKKMFFKVGNVVASSNLISGKYYDYKKIIPEEERNRIKVSTQGLKEAITRVSVASDVKTGAIVKLSVEDKTLTILAEEKDSSFARESIVGTVTGKNNDFLIKTQFVLDPLNEINSEHVIIDYGEKSKDLIKIITESDKNTIHIAAQIIQ